MIRYEEVFGNESTVGEFSQLEKDFFNSQRILITGAGGSIGTEIVALISNMTSAIFMATDHDESRLHSLSLKISPQNVFPNLNFCLLDIRDEIGMDHVCNTFQPTMVIHAAALKHLSVLQLQPREAFLTNVLGTKYLLDTCQKFGVKFFVNISTDKAADPTSVLGNSKKLTELMVAEINRMNPDYRYISCRFGNVFASRGSVIETFESQIHAGIPLTITDRRATRYFMSIPEAAFLSLKSSFLGSGDLYLFDMGQPKFLIDIVNRILEIKESNVGIIEVGLRKGEKLHEVLSSQDDKLKKTNHPKILEVDITSILEQNRHLIPKIQPSNCAEITSLLINGLNS